MTNSDNQAIEVIPTLLVGDSSFDSDTIPFCTLCIEVDERRIRFCIIKDENMECIWLEDYGFQRVLNKNDVFERLKKSSPGIYYGLPIIGKMSGSLLIHMHSV